MTVIGDYAKEHPAGKTAVNRFRKIMVQYVLLLMGVQESVQMGLAVQLRHGNVEMPLILIGIALARQQTAPRENAILPVTPAMESQKMKADRATTVQENVVVVAASLMLLLHIPANQVADNVFQWHHAILVMIIMEQEALFAHHQILSAVCR
jgi:hypothetical protein